MCPLMVHVASLVLYVAIVKPTLVQCIQASPEIDPGKTKDLRTLLFLSRSISGLAQCIQVSLILFDKALGIDN